MSPTSPGRGGYGGTSPQYSRKLFISCASGSACS
jgi:hypothetical protein